MAPGDLEQILEGLPFGGDNANVLVGGDSHDDAAVYRLSEDRALVFTVDLITPIVDDPVTFGRIAANNALSDVYAMGARPLMALNVSCFSPKLPNSASRGILHGAQLAADEARCPILGGHSVKDGEVKFGLAVVGEVHPDRIVRNDRASAGDVLVITKGIGTAALATAFMADAFDASDARYQGLVEALTQSNREAMRIALGHGVHAATDVTGFGLAGHLLEMLGSSGLGVSIDYDQVPILEGALEALADGHTCGGGRSNAAFTSSRVRPTRKLTRHQLEVLQDPQTAGPLLLAVSASNAPALVEELRRTGYHQAVVIGGFSENGGGIVEVK